MNLNVKSNEKNFQTKDNQRPNLKLLTKRRTGGALLPNTYREVKSSFISTRRNDMSSEIEPEGCTK